jgi:mannose-6-phosphate isomerase
LEIAQASWARWPWLGRFYKLILGDSEMVLNSFLRMDPEYRDYIWGGDRLRPGIDPTAEAWVVWEEDRIQSGDLAGLTLGEVAAQFGESLLGQRTVARTGNKFPLLIKLLDCAQWLSLQVHPNDRQAIELEGPGQFGKTEAWHILESKPDAKLIAGATANTSADILAAAIRNSSVIDHVQYITVSAGDTIFMPAGTLHALGPGLLIYEVQQSSDLTYRVYDWGRPETEKRQLHIEQSIQVARADFTSKANPMPVCGDGTRHMLVQCEYFSLELLSAVSNSIDIDTHSETFHAITMIDGRGVLQSNGERVELEKFQTVVVPASLGRYQFQPLDGNCRALKASV